MARYRKHFKHLAVGAAVVLATASYASYKPVHRPTSVYPAPAPTQVQTVVQQPAPAAITGNSNCKINGPEPDKTCTPGAVFPNVTAAQVCVSGYSSGVRNVPQALKDAVYGEYGITSHAPGQYEVDHFISLELGGTNDQSNLWPEPATPVPGFHEKDTVENYLHSQVCSGAMTLAEAQKEISTDWLAVYNTKVK